MELSGQEIPLKASPSLQYNNLTGIGDRFAYVHKSEVHVVNVATKESSSFPLKDKVPAYQAKVYVINGVQILVIATQGGVQFWDFAREKFLTAVTQADGGKDTFLSRGIAALTLGGKSVVLVGHSSGDISVIEFAGESATVVNVLKEHHEVITDISSAPEPEAISASADIAGEIVVWTPGLTVQSRLDRVQGDVCTSLAVANGFVVGGFGSGKVIVFNPVSGKRVVEFTAHCRWINSIDFSPQRNTLATVGEDNLIQLWKMPTQEDRKVALKGHRFVKDALLTGVKFSEGRVAYVAYDTEKLFLSEAP